MAESIIRGESRLLNGWGRVLPYWSKFIIAVVYMYAWSKLLLLDNINVSQLNIYAFKMYLKP